jgi:hypothetical protein
MEILTEYKHVEQRKERSLLMLEYLVSATGDEKTLGSQAGARPKDRIKA